MEPTDPLVVELNGVSFFAANSDGRLKFFKDVASVGTVKHS